MSRRVLAASCAAAFISSLANAAPPAHVVRVQPVVALPAQPDAATMAAAMHYLDVVQFEETSLRTGELMVGASFAAMVNGLHKQMGDQVPQDLVDQLHKAIHDHAMNTLRADLPDMKRKTAAVYASEFTRDELVRLAELQADPVAVKARERSKEMQPRLMEIGINAMRASEPQLDAEIKKIVADYLAAHGDRSHKSSAS
jgi:hypothetical protein